MGWTWDYSIPSGATDNLIVGNLVHHLGNGDLSDLGGVYLLGVSNGTVVRENVVHSVLPYYMYGHGIYLDQATSNVVVERNLAFNTEAAGFLQHFGRNNTVSNNILALAHLGQLWEANFQAGQFGTSSLRFERNIVYTSSPVFQAPFNGTWTSDYNLFFNATPGALLSATFPQPHWDKCRVYNSPACAANTSMTAWALATGNDIHSKVADPQFIDVTTGDFRVSASSPALGLGFTPFDPGLAGPRGSATRPEWEVEFIGCRVRRLSERSTAATHSCGDPGELANGTRSGLAFECGDVLVYRCNPGFINLGGTWRMCTGLGWTGQVGHGRVPTTRGTADTYTHVPAIAFQ